VSRWVVIITIVLMGLVGSGNALTLSGSGTQEDPWRIESRADFDEFVGDANYWDDYTRLETDVNLAGRTYATAVIAPDVNDARSWFQGTAFTGVFDGNDHKVENLTIDDGGAGNDYLGLFGFIRYGEVSNLGLEGCSVSGMGYDVGGLAGVNDGSISNCYSTGDVSGGQDVGGLVGRNFSSVSNCYSSGNVSGSDEVGGLVGENYSYGSISYCCSTGDVNGEDSVGGLVGLTSGYCSVSNCYSTGNVSGEYRVGGLVGSDAIVMKHYSTGNASGKHVADGLAEYKVGGISNCYSTGDVNGVDYVGGLKGLNRKSVSNCYSTGKVDGTGILIGGLVGANGYMTTMGCLFGVIRDCYWNTETSGEPKMCGVQGPCSSYGCDPNYGKTTAEMHQQSTFTNWDFINVWDIGENQTYPYIRTVPAGDINHDRIVNLFDFAIIADQWMNEE